MKRDLAKHYGVRLDSKILGAIRESLTDVKGDDLVDRHLRANYGYFGAIDKTLSGFVVLDDTGDDFMLLDLRDSGQVYFQDHDDRDVDVVFDSIDDYVGFKKAVAAAGDDADQDDLRAEWGTAKARAKKKPTTPQLCARYQWLVWLLGQPMDRGPANEDNEARQAVDTAMDIFSDIFPKDAGRALFAKERPLLAKDPYVALYWLLHTTMVGQHEARAVVLAAAKKSKHPLLAAFAKRFGALALSSDLPVVSRFVARRSGATLFAGEDRALDALAIDANNHAAGRLVVEMLENETVSPSAVRSALGDDGDTLPRALALAVADLRDGKASSRHADIAIKLASKTGADWDNAAGAVLRVHALARDAAVVRALEVLLERDTYHAGLLRVAAAVRARTKKRLFGDDDTFAKRLATAEKTAGLLEALEKKKPSKVLASVDEQIAPLFARRILERLALGEMQEPEVVGWAFARVVKSKSEDRFALAAHAMQYLDRYALEGVLPHLAKEAKSPKHPVVDLLLRFVESAPEPRNNDDAESAFDGACDVIFHVLAKHAGDARVAERLVAVLEQGEARPITVRSFIGECLSPYSKKGYVLPKLGDAHATRIAKALVHINALAPSKRTGHLCANAGHQLFRFKHRGAEAALIEALHDYTKRYADEAPAERYEDVVANLYQAVTNMKSERARAALVERLFLERREFWRLGSALHESFSPELHRLIVRELGKRNDAMALVKYTYAIASHIAKVPLLLDLAPQLAKATAPREARARAFFKCALLTAKHAALVAKRLDLVRALHGREAELREKPLDLHLGASWKSPFEDKSKLRALGEALAGLADG